MKIYYYERIYISKKVDNNTIKSNKTIIRLFQNDKYRQKYSKHKKILT